MESQRFSVEMPGSTNASPRLTAGLYQEGTRAHCRGRILLFEDLLGAEAACLPGREAAQDRLESGAHMGWVSSRGPCNASLIGGVPRSAGSTIAPPVQGRAVGIQVDYRQQGGVQVFEGLCPFHCGRDAVSELAVRAILQPIFPRLMRVRQAMHRDPQYSERRIFSLP